MAITIAHTAEHFAAIERLARQIVPDFYAPFFARNIGEYLVESGHTVGALAAQADNGYRHYLIEVEARAVGYFSLGVDEDSVLLSHFYILQDYRGQGLGQLAMDFIDAQVAEMGVRTIELLVLRENAAAVGLYRKNGFFVADEVLTRLGNGAVLEDYLMRKDIDN